MPCLPASKGRCRSTGRPCLPSPASSPSPTRLGGIGSGRSPRRLCLSPAAEQPHPAGQAERRCRSDTRVLDSDDPRRATMYTSSHRRSSMPRSRSSSEPETPGGDRPPAAARANARPRPHALRVHVNAIPGVSRDGCATEERPRAGFIGPVALGHRCRLPTRDIQSWAMSVLVLVQAKRGSTYPLAGAATVTVGRPIRRTSTRSGSDIGPARRSGGSQAGGEQAVQDLPERLDGH